VEEEDLMRAQRSEIIVRNELILHGQNAIGFGQSSVTAHDALINQFASHGYALPHRLAMLFPCMTEKRAAGPYRLHSGATWHPRTDNNVW
jgi:hypothetical protein